MHKYKMLLNEYKEMLKAINNFKNNNGRLPNYYDWNTKINGVKTIIRLTKEKYQNAIDRVNAFSNKEKRDPNHVTVEGSEIKPTSDKKTKSSGNTTSGSSSGNTASSSSKNIISGSFKPSCSYCGPKLGYKLFTTSFENKCGRCGRVGKMTDTPKGGRAKIPEGEWTCDTKLGGCGADFCGVCGKEKMNPAKGWLTQVDVPDKVKK